MPLFRNKKFPLFISDKCPFYRNMCPFSFLITAIFPSTECPFLFCYKCHFPFLYNKFLFSPTISFPFTLTGAIFLFNFLFPSKKVPISPFPISTLNVLSLLIDVSFISEKCPFQIMISSFFLPIFPYLAHRFCSFTVI